MPRYHAMKGQDVPRKAGWDTHGLPVELEVEKELGLDGKEQIEEYGMAEFIDRCKKSVWTYKGMWEDFSDTVGFWADMEHPYVTYHNDYIESEWWALKTIFDKGLLYKGYKIVPYCPRCGTPLSSHEVAQGYKDVKERSAIVRFQAEGRGKRLPPGLDHHPLDPALQRGAVRQSRRRRTPRVKCGDEIYLPGRGAAGRGARGGKIRGAFQPSPAKSWNTGNTSPCIGLSSRRKNAGTSPATATSP